MNHTNAEDRLLLLGIFVGQGNGEVASVIPYRDF